MHSAAELVFRNYGKRRVSDAEGQSGLRVCAFQNAVSFLKVIPYNIFLISSPLRYPDPVSERTRSVQGKERMRGEQEGR